MTVPALSNINSKYNNKRSILKWFLYNKSAGSINPLFIGGAPAVRFSGIITELETLVKRRRSFSFITFRIQPVGSHSIPHHWWLIHNLPVFELFRPCVWVTGAKWAVLKSLRYSTSVWRPHAKTINSSVPSRKWWRCGRPWSSTPPCRSGRWLGPTGRCWCQCDLRGWSWGRWMDG